MEWMLIILILVAALLLFIAKKTKKSAVGEAEAIAGISQKPNAEETQCFYQKQNVLFSPAERSFLGVLHQAVSENIQVFGKVRVADVITPQKGMSRSEWQKAFNRISRKHFDFLLCNKSDLSILCAVELDDSSHNTRTRKDRDVFLENACKSANVPLLQIAAQSKYNIHKLQKSLAVYLPSGGTQSLPATERSVAAIDRDQASDNGGLCPECSAKMVKKVAKKGKNIGKVFWACSNFPKCRHIKAIKG